MTTTPAARDERQLFEAAYLKDYFYPAQRWSLVPEKYRTQHADIAWRAWQARAALAESELAEVRGEVAELDALRERQQDLLSQTAIAIRGPEPALTRWSHADIPSRVKAVVDERDELRAELERVKKFDRSAMRAAARKAAPHIPGDMIDHILFAAIGAGEGEGG